MRVDKITITGLDVSTDLDRVRKIYMADLGLIEFAVLFGERESPRYPKKVVRTAMREQLSDLRLSAHLCGKYVKSYLNYNDPSWQEVHDYEAVQFNVNLEALNKIDFYQLFESINDYDNGIGDPILQLNTNNAPYLPYQYRGRVLVDSSGGNGQELSLENLDPSFLLRKDKLIGFAGGFTPGNILGKLYDIETYVSRHGHEKMGITIDVESGVRDANNRLDLDLVEEFIQNVKKFRRKSF